ncbi:50S ribosomal protein L25/general stress protein Ctc [Arthrobacter sp. efr-133-TYG-104]|uniref:50S ribosomal protein L25/general stress protein Ctc n=1 Tax=Arthrobacter sp. efr-133-TYG-104 TaxID=3040324 RepID=UPI00254B9F36|nr:50S ribosomal protein L25/general stress protein Ctc [Arthrobacter sp. efr-133-TYG-104]
MSEQKLTAELRTEFGKGFARRARMAGQIPAVIYGHGAEPIHINLPGRATTLAVRVSNALLAIDVDGQQHLTLVKDIQRDPVKQIIEHVDLQTVQAGEKVTVDIAIHVSGEVAPGAVASLEATTVSLESEATHVPTAVEVSIEGLKAGQNIHAADLNLPKGSTLLTEGDTLVVRIAEAAGSEEEESGEAAAE